MNLFTISTKVGRALFWGALLVVSWACGNGGGETPDAAAGGDSDSDADGDSDTTPAVTECNDGVDNDGDGLVDWQYDVGCYGSRDLTEAGGSPETEDGWTTFDMSPDSQVIYVSASTGDDGADGLSPETAVATPARGAELVRDGYPDFLLFRRGDTWRGEDLGPDRVVRRFKSGRDAEHPIVIYSFGDSTERPRLEIDKHFIDHDGNERNYLAVVGLAFVSYPKAPADPEFSGVDGGGLRLIGTGHDILVEDNYFEYGEIIVQNETDVAIRRNVVYRSYEVGTCAYNDDGSRNPNGNSAIRPSGIFCGGVDGLRIEGNVWDENGWNPDVAEACATIYNHDLYLSGNRRVTVLENLILRASSIGIKVSSSETGEVTDFTIENNLFAEGEIGISMGGNADTAHRFVNTAVRDNVFTDIGRSQPTTRELSWYVDIIDNDGAVITGNLMVNQPPLSNPRGIHLEGDSNREITISDNVLYGLRRRLLSTRAAGAWESIAVTGNTFVAEGDESCLVSHDDGIAPFTFSDNRYGSGAAADSWFCVDGDRRDLDGWTTLTGAAQETAASSSAPDPGRNLDSYAEHLGLGDTLADFAAAARGQSRHQFDDALTAAAANTYIREGYGADAR